MNANKRKEIFARFAAANPNPTTELEYENTFQLLIAVLLSAQATDRSVNIATRNIFDTCKTPQDILDMGLDAFTEAIRTIGLYKTKAKNALRTCEILQEKHNGEVPDDREALEALPGVGRKTANVVLNTAFGHPTMAVDTHIFRLSNRTGIAPGKNVVEVEKKLLRFVPKEYMFNAHHWLILHGRYVCLARKPKCPQCGINDLCEYKEKTPAGK
ncbi:MAG: endonuclease III [Alcaligenaceae bacterium]|nr:endonuclease III [Alcaligenaceae bacterium]